MPQPVDTTALAASAGDDQKRERARREVARAFFQKHLYEAVPAAERDWEIVVRALQCIDFSRPVTFGPKPLAPIRLAPLRSNRLGAGFFAELPPDGAGDAEHVDQEAPYMRYFTRAAAEDRTVGTLRYYIPPARVPQTPS